MVVDKGNSNMYEEARKKRLDENKKRFEELGILDISKSLSKLSSPEKTPKPRPLNSSAANTEVTEPRRSSRARNTVTSYQEDFHSDIDLSHRRKKARFSSSSSSSSWTSYIARPLAEVKLAAYEDRVRALRAAEEFQTSLQSGKPSFVKSMVRSHVYSCFWLGLPTQFCKDHLPKKDLDMILEDEDGSICDAKYLGSRTGLSGGWRGFALDHKLDDGDAVVFELVEPNKFKVYTFKVPSPLSSKTREDVAEEEGSAKAKNASRNQNKSRSTKKQKPKKAKANKASNTETSDLQEKSESETQVDVADEDASVKEKNTSGDQNKSQAHSTKKQNCKRAKARNMLNIETSKSHASEMISSDEPFVEKNGVIDKKDASAVNKEVESLEKNENKKMQTVKPKKKSAPKLFRRRA